MAVEPSVLVDEFLHHLQYARGYSDHTLHAYRADLDQFLKFLENRAELDAFPDRITRLNVRAYLAHLNENSYSKSSVRRKLSSLRSFFKRLVRLKTTENNPLVGVHTPQAEPRIPKYLTHCQLLQVLTHNPIYDIFGTRDKAIIGLLAATGMCVSELVGMNKSDVDLAHSTVGLRGKKERMVEIDSITRSWLVCYMKALNEMFRRDNWPKAAPALFTNEKTGDRLTTRSIGRILDKWRLQAKLTVPLSPNILRNTLVVRMLEEERTVAEIQAVLGYESVGSINGFKTIAACDKQLGKVAPQWRSKS